MYKVSIVLVVKFDVVNNVLSRPTFILVLSLTYICLTSKVEFFVFGRMDNSWILQQAQNQILILIDKPKRLRRRTNSNQVHERTHMASWILDTTILVSSSVSATLVNTYQTLLSTKNSLLYKESYSKGFVRNYWC